MIATDFHDWAATSSRAAARSATTGVLGRHHSALGRPEGRLSFAGADLAVRWIGWIDGALETGARAAREALDRLGRRTPLFLMSE